MHISRLITLFLLLGGFWTGATFATPVPVFAAEVAESPIIAQSPNPLVSPVLPVAPASMPGVPCGTDALILLAAQDVAEMRQTLAALEAAGGCALHIFPPRAVIGQLPAGTGENGAGLPGIVTVFWEPVPAADVDALEPEVYPAALVWNRMHAAARMGANTSGEQTPQAGAPLVNDFLPSPPPPDAMMSAAAGGAPGYYQVSEYMAGQISIGIILPESNGAVDPSTENWQASRMDNVLGEIADGLTWWAENNPSGNLSFVYDIHKQVSTRYEPISRGSDQDGLWIRETLAAIGYDGRDKREQAYAYLNDLRRKNKTDWAAVVFVVDSKNDPDGMFSNDYFGYSYGHAIVMTYDNDGWGIDGMNHVLAHEFAHNFGAADQYCSPSYFCCEGGGQYGYLGIPNGGCEAGCDRNGNGICDGDDHSPGFACLDCPVCVETPSIMRQGSVDAGLDLWTLHQIGMRDSDGDGIPDPIDTVPLLVMDLWPRDVITTNTATYAGVAMDQPYESPTKPNVTINSVASVLYVLDGETEWRVGDAADGAFDTPTESYTLTLRSLAEGPHSIWMIATNRAGNVSTWISDTFTVDTVAPVGGVLVEADAAYATARPVTLRLAAHDTGTGLDQMVVGGRADFQGATWLPFAAEVPWTLAAQDGPQSVYVKFRDRAGNVSVVYSDTIILDTVPPTAGITIAGAATYVTSPVASLAIGGQDRVSGVDRMRLSHDGQVWAAWQPFTPAATWMLADGDGTKTVYVQTQDRAGHISAPAQDTVVLDQTPPVSKIEELFRQKDGLLAVRWSGSDATSGVAAYNVEVWDQAGETWERWLTGVTQTSAAYKPTPGHTYYFRVRAIDGAGNIEPRPPRPTGEESISTDAHIFLPLITR